MGSDERSRFDDIALPPRRSSNAVIWVLILGGIGLFGLAGCCGCAGVGIFLITRDDITNTTWRGTENLPGFGPLVFEFKKDNVAIMKDAKANVRGSWTQNGKEVTIRFTNCEYRGTINGRTMSGTAHGAGMLMGQRWQFNVVRD
jgi:hypothetical protein